MTEKIKDDFKTIDLAAQQWFELLLAIIEWRQSQEEKHKKVNKSLNTDQKNI